MSEFGTTRVRVDDVETTVTEPVMHAMEEVDCTHLQSTEHTRAELQLLSAYVGSSETPSKYSSIANILSRS